MKNKRLIFPICFVLAILATSFTLSWAREGGSISLATNTPLGSGFTYQGYLTDGGAPANGVYNFEFTLYDAETEGISFGTANVDEVTVDEGLFTVQIDFGSGVFDGDARWLAIGVQPGDETGAYTPLEPRQPITPSTYAFYAVDAGSMEWSGLSNIPSGLDDGDDDTLYTAGTGLSLDGSQFSVLTDTIQTRVLDACSAGYAIRQINADGSVVCEVSNDPTAFWSLTGNAGTTPGVNYLGTTDEVSLTLAVSGTSALRLEPTSGTPNLIGGYSGNYAAHGVSGAVIAGGGASGWPINFVTDNYGVVGGGYGNQAGNADSNLSNSSYATVSGGVDNEASGGASFVGGGESNTAVGSHAVISGGSSNQTNGNNATIGGGNENSIYAFGATIGGGDGNRIENDWATIGGGWGNENYGDYATIGGGYDNTINTNLGTIPGGASNIVEEEYGFAAGRRAIAAHQGVFVWADSTNADFSSTASNQFAVRANGGVLFSTGGASFTIDGADVWTSANVGDGSGLEADLLDGKHGSDFQNSITGNCSPGSTVRVVNTDGSVECQTDGPFNRSVSPTGIVSTTLDTISTYYLHTSITIGTDGLPIISYHYGTNKDLKVAHCNDTNCTSAFTNTLDSAGDVGWDNSIIIGSDGLPIISYVDSTNKDLKVAHCNDNSCTSATITAVDTVGITGSSSSITIGSDGYPIISYLDATNGDLNVAHCEDIACTTIISNTMAIGYRPTYTSITIGADGLPVIGFFSNNDGYFYVTHCNDITCTSSSTIMVDSVINAGWYTSITIGEDGLPIMSYYDYTNKNLKLAHCDDLACTSATLTTLDTGTNVGSYTSITIGTDGIPIISYLDAHNGNLKVAHCNDLICTSASKVTIDAGDYVGQYTSITIGIDGFPIISYFDNTNGALKVIHCSNQFCVPYWRRR